MEVEIKVLKMKRENISELPLPRYMTDKAAGMDLYADVGEQVVIKPSGIALIPTGLKVAIPDGYEIQIRPRSGLAIRNGITVLNTPGTIDGDYRGEIGIILINAGSEPFVVSRGDRVAQMVVAPVVRARLVVVDALDDTDRGEGGFGQTGIR